MLLRIKNSLKPIRETRRLQFRVGLGFKKKVRSRSEHWYTLHLYSEPALAGQQNLDPFPLSLNIQELFCFRFIREQGLGTITEKPELPFKSSIPQHPALLIESATYISSVVQKSCPTFYSSYHHFSVRDGACGVMAFSKVQLSSWSDTVRYFITTSQLETSHQSPTYLCVISGNTVWSKCQVDAGLNWKIQLDLCYLRNAIFFGSSSQESCWESPAGGLHRQRQSQGPHDTRKLTRFSLPWVIILHFTLYQLLCRLNWLYPVMYSDQLPLST